jgi:tetratricopeptide (TPR) repeat protein
MDKRTNGGTAALVRGALALAAVLVLVSCSDLADGWSVVQGNAAYQRGEFQKASLSYLAAQGTGAVRDVVNYNLGNVYNALGETNTALATWSRIDKPSTEELAYRLAFNKGYLLYQRGQYEDACREFRTALLMKPASLDAKRNLEICLLKTQNFGTALPARSRTADKTDPNETQKALLDYINRLEGNRWKANNRPDTTVTSSSDW